MKSKDALYRFIKRLMDISLSLVLLLILSPLLILIALTIRLDSPGPPVHRAKRSGKDGQLFTLHKFRSMIASADKLGPGITNANDPRITRVGAFLRKTKLDELPQLWNVLIGDMSLVGPRPEDPQYVALYTESQAKILEAKPGLTSMASITYRDEENLLEGEDWELVYVNQIMHEKIRIDLAYMEEATLGKDIGIILKTISALFKK